MTERSAIIYASGFEEKTISRHFAPEETGSLLEFVLDSVWTVADELFVIFNNEPKLSLIEAISPFGVKILTVSKEHSPLQAIGDAFRASRSELSLIATERVPLLKPNVALKLFEAARDHDAAIPVWPNGKTDPMLAVYRRNAMTKLISTVKPPHGKDVFKAMEALAQQLFAVKNVMVDSELRELDPELDSFLEVKNAKTLELARSKASLKAR